MPILWICVKLVILRRDIRNCYRELPASIVICIQKEENIIYSTLITTFLHVSQLRISCNHSEMIPSDKNIGFRTIYLHTKTLNITHILYD